MIQQAVLNGRNSRQERRGTLGFTLVEVIVAIGVLSVAITIFAGLFGGSTELAKLAQQLNSNGGLTAQMEKASSPSGRVMKILLQVILLKPCRTHLRAYPP
mgnify:CR=1 FL=1